MVRLSIPAQLVFRDLALSAVLTALDAAGEGPGAEARDEIVSALGEAYNNIVLHAYRGTSGGRIDLAVAVRPGEVEIQLRDHGRGFDPTGVAGFTGVPSEDSGDVDIAALPESGMGLFIMRSFMDDVAYTSGEDGEPNVLVLRKRWAAAEAPRPIAPPRQPAMPRKETSQSGWRMRSVAVPPEASAVRTAGSLKRK